jgi:hypothetical protein
MEFTSKSLNFTTREMTHGRKHGSTKVGHVIRGKDDAYTFDLSPQL